MELTRVLKSTMMAAVVAGAMMIAPAAANARVFVSVGFAPPAIPVYTQPLCPGYGYIWTPGYWAYGDNGYDWVDGAWVEPPYEGALWTPGYWGWGDSGYFWNPGYWGLTVGYYGGINYGFGYFGTGFWGGYWNRGHFFYNSAYNHIGFHDHDGFVYNHHVSGFDGRPGGNSFARNEGNGFRGGDMNRGAGINGHNFADHGGNSFAGNHGPQQVGFRNGFSGNGARPQYNAGEAHTFNGGNSFAQSRGSFGGTQPQPHSFAAAQPQARSFGGAQPQARSFGGGGNFAAPQARSFSGGNNPGGGAAHANFGGGGGFHGGGGGGHR